MVEHIDANRVTIFSSFDYEFAIALRRRCEVATPNVRNGDVRQGEIRRNFLKLVDAKSFVRGEL